jgi:hypothetical protein
LLGGYGVLAQTRTILSKVALRENRAANGHAGSL